MSREAEEEPWVGHLLKGRGALLLLQRPPGWGLPPTGCPGNRKPAGQDPWGRQEQSHAPEARTWGVAWAGPSQSSKDHNPKAEEAPEGHTGRGAVSAPERHLPLSHGYRVHPDLSSHPDLSLHPSCLHLDLSLHPGCLRWDLHLHPNLSLHPDLHLHASRLHPTCRP